MKIYTKTGDKGETSLYGGKRVQKDALRIETYGTVDELNSVIGVCRSMGLPPEIDRFLEQIQRDLFALGAALATPHDSSRNLPSISAQEISRLEHHIDEIDPLVKPLKHFILPGGSQAGALLHFARAVCRRAERLLVRLSREESTGAEPLVYLNRLSDLLFMAARRMSFLENSPEMEWRPDA